MSTIARALRRLPRLRQGAQPIRLDTRVRDTKACSRSSSASRPYVRLAAGMLVIVVATITGGCAVVESLLSGVPLTSGPSASPCIDAWPTVQASLLPQRQLVDVSNGFALALPANWRRLVPGDAGWATIYGSQPSTTEQQVAVGTIQDYAVPLEPRDCDLVVNLAVYVRTVPTNVTLERVADEYDRTMTTDPEPARPIGRAHVDLPAGAAERITALRAHTLGATGFDDRLVVYILASGGHAYYLVFVSSDSSADRYAPIFSGIARSFVYTTPAQ